MGIERLVPGVQDQRGAELATQILLTKLEERLTHRAKQQAQEGAFVVQDEGIKGMRDSKHRMEVRRGKQLSLLRFHPLGRGPRLTCGTVAIPARAIRIALKAALRTPLRMPPELGRATGEESVNDLVLGRGDPIALPIAVAIEAADVGDFPPRPIVSMAGCPLHGDSPPAGGIASLRYGTGQPFSASQQIEGAVDFGQVLPSDMQISGRRVDAPVAEQELNSPQIHPGFEQMRGKTVAQRMDAFAVGDPRQPLGVVVELLGTSDGHRLGAVLRRKEPWRGAVALPVGAEFREEPGRQQRGAVLPPFALIDANQPTVTFDVGELQPHDFPNAQARGIGRHEQHAMAGGRGTA